MSVDSARKHCSDLLSKQDRSSYILTSYLPPRARDAFIAVRAFNLETSRVIDTSSNPDLAKLRFEFWKSIIQKSLSSGTTVPPEPVALLLSHAYNHDAIALSKRFLITLVQTREQFVSQPPVRNVDALCSFGEGTYSQLNYLMLETMYSVAPKVNEFLHNNPEVVSRVEDMVAHIGQATGVTTFLRGLRFFSEKMKTVPLPVDIMSKHGVSQQSVLDHFATGAPIDSKINDVVFETATRANDHILSARSIMKGLTDDLGDLPDAIVVPALTAVPVQLYLERLERCNFDPLHKDLTKSEWRLPYRSYKAFKQQMI